MKSMVVAAFLLFGFTHCDRQQAKVIDMKADVKIEEEKVVQLVKSVFEELINKRNPAAIDKLYAPNMTDHGAWEGQAPGIEGFRKSVTDFIAMFPDLQVTVDNIIVAGDFVATKDSWKGTHLASKKIVAGETMHVFRIVNGKITDEWSNGWEWLEGL